jgi:alkanesulfonate monooxygenase SsuD/methylene tetrahydromethanopterin reductase-like flavin-dependent oxidoreductase (luciferase family)
MDVGIGLPAGIPGTDGEAIVAWARRAEAAGFASLDVVDRLAYDAYDPLVALSAAAAVTERIALATTILISPLRNTPLLAKQLASLHLISGGRLVLGVGIGAREDDYARAGVEHATRGRRLAEQMAQIVDLFEDGGTGLRTAAHERPLLLAGGGSAPAFARMARHADGYIHGGGPPRAFARAAEQARAAWIDAGRPGVPALWSQAYFALGDAAPRGTEYMRDYYAFLGPFAEKIAAGMLATSQQAVEFLHAYAEAGCDHVCVMPAVADLDQVDALAEAVAEAAVGTA